MVLPGPDVGDVVAPQRESYARSKTSAAAQYRNRAGVEEPKKPKAPKQRKAKEKTDGE